jgi:putative addiction module component (TIGR02574 family)
MLIDQIKKLSKSEKILLVSELWDDIADAPEDLELTDEQLRRLDERYEEFRRHPDQGVQWTVVRERIKRML